MLPTHTLPPLADPPSLVRVMGKLHRRLLDDLATRATDPRVEPSLREAWHDDRKNNRTGESFETYRDAFCDQVAASWILCTVFARTLEDRGYIPHRLAGPGAIERHAMFRSAYKFLGERDYLLHIFDGIALLPGAFDVFGPGHAALWRLGPTSRALAELLDELRAVDNGQLRFSFGRSPDRDDPAGASTRYLGDLYQDLNEGVRKRYALLQTPDFVERFLLDNTLDPAMAERGYAVTLLDPACGSGHLLLGAYDRLFARHRRDEPGRPLHESAKLALGQVYGIDLNPYAAAVARFRLLLSYLDKAEFESFAQIHEVKLPLHVYVGDSLLAGQGEAQATFGDRHQGDFGARSIFSFSDPEADELLLKKRFDVIVANPPYITEKDAAKRDLIRKRYPKSATGKYALSAPFAERIFLLGNLGAWTGQITANSFMKREFGKGLVEKVFKDWDLGQVIDTSGAFIPGHGTPTVILFGRSQQPISKNVPVVMGIRGEPSTPEDPAQGKVWLSIAEHYREIGFENEFISVAEVEREKLEKHPWSIGGGGAAELKELLEERAGKKLGDVADSIGISSFTLEDDVYMAPRYAHVARGLTENDLRSMIEGDIIRDWSMADAPSVVFPYNGDLNPFLSKSQLHYLWPFKTSIGSNILFGGKTKVQGGFTWFEFGRLTASKLRTPLSITFAEVATHNHFVLDRGGKVFKQTAPIIKLPEGATEDEHLALLGYLNSSTACFWMKQVCFDKGNRGEGGGTTSEEWERFFQFSSTAIKAMPLPNEAIQSNSTLRRFANTLSQLGERWEKSRLKSQWIADLNIRDGEPLRACIDDLISAQQNIENEIRAAQEQLDWYVYFLMGLCAPELVEDTGAPRNPGERVSDLLYSRAILSENGSRRYFELCRLPAPEILANQTLEPIDQKRMEAIRSNSMLQLLEQPGYKRTYRESFRPVKVNDVLETFLLARAETFFQAREPRPLPIRTIADALHRDPKIRAVAEVLTGSAQFDLESLLADLCQQDAVASSSCHVYTDAGIETRRTWENVWHLQRQEDARKPDDPEIKVDPPPKYDQKDFENAATVWRLRGKLDVPKERFIAYPTATPPPGTSGKPGLVFGWAGWDHLQKLQATIELWQEEIGLHGQDILPRATREQIGEGDLTDERLMRHLAARSKLFPLLQTMVDLLPWIKQWHDEDRQTASAFSAYITEEARKLEMTLDEAHEYRRPAKGSAPKARKATSTKKEAPEDADGAAPEKKARKPRAKKAKAD